MRIVDTYPDLSRKELVERINAHITNEFEIADESARFSGLLVLYNNMLQSLFSSQIVTLGVVFLGIMLMFFVYDLLGHGVSLIFDSTKDGVNLLIFAHHLALLLQQLEHVGHV